MIPGVAESWNSITSGDTQFDITLRWPITSGRLVNCLVYHNMKLNIASTRVVKMFLCFSYHDTFGVMVKQIWLHRAEKTCTNIQRSSKSFCDAVWCLKQHCAARRRHNRRGEILCKHSADGGSLLWRYVALKTGAGNLSFSRWSSRKKKKNERIYLCFYVRYQFHVVTTLCFGAARLGFRHKIHKNSWKMCQRLDKNVWCCHASRCWNTMSKSGVLLGNRLTQL